MSVVSVSPSIEHRPRRRRAARPPAPLIAVSTSEIRPGSGVSATPEGEPPQPEMVLGLRYLKAIEAAGGVPVVIPPLADEYLGPLLDRVAGLCLSGGPDLHPTAYRQREHEQLGPTWPELDGFELALVRAADRRGLPILAICRGLQVLNVARGGTLHQHLPAVVGTRITHRQHRPGDQPTHPVSFIGASRLSRILGLQRIWVNSFHHQAVDRLGDRLVPTSRAVDGTVESLEAEDRPFVLAVQWHAECLTGRTRHFELFRAFVDAAGRFSEHGALESAA